MYEVQKNVQCCYAYTLYILEWLKLWSFKTKTPTKSYRWGIYGFFFLCLLTSGSQVIIKKSTNDTFFLSKMTSLFSQSSFWIRKVNIWWLFNDKLRAIGREPEKKGTTNSAPIAILSRILFRLIKTTVKLQAVDRSTIQFWKLLAKGHSTY